MFIEKSFVFKAGGKMIGSDLEKWRHFTETAAIRIRAARCKVATFPSYGKVWG